MAKKAILIVDPYQEVAKFVANILEEGGYKVTSVQSLTEATTLLSNSRFDLIITEALDQSRKVPFDPSFLAQLRSFTSNTAIMLFSTYAANHMICPSDFGLADVVPKPFDIDKLLEKVNKLVGKENP